MEVMCDKIAYVLHVGSKGFVVTMWFWERCSVGGFRKATSTWHTHNTTM